MSECPWWINSPEHQNCLWIYVLEKSGPDGSMPELAQAEMANLLGCSNTKVHFMLKQAMEELVEALKIHQANQFISQDSEETHDLLTHGLNVVPSRSSEDDE